MRQFLVISSLIAGLGLWTVFVIKYATISQDEVLKILQNNPKVLATNADKLNERGVK